MESIKNYKEQGGSKWIIGGTFEITKNGEMTIEGIKFTRAEFQEYSNATTVAGLKDDLNSLIDNLKNAGIIKTT